MLLLLVSQPGACPGPQTPSPSRTPARPSAPDALFDSWPRNLCSSRFFVWKRKVLFRLIFVWSNIWRIKRKPDVQWWDRCESGQTDVIAVLHPLFLHREAIVRKIKDYLRNYFLKYFHKNSLILQTMASFSTLSPSPYIYEIILYN